VVHKNPIREKGRGKKKISNVRERELRLTIGTKKKKGEGGCPDTSGGPGYQGKKTPIPSIEKPGGRKGVKGTNMREIKLDYHADRKGKKKRNQYPSTKTNRGGGGERENFCLGG